MLNKYTSNNKTYLLFCTIVVSSTSRFVLCLYRRHRTLTHTVKHIVWVIVTLESMELPCIIF